MTSRTETKRKIKKGVFSSFQNFVAVITLSMTRNSQARWCSEVKCMNMTKYATQNATACNKITKTYVHHLDQINVYTKHFISNVKKTI